jgi:hypothetical protein
VFKDGTLIELINFFRPPPGSGRWDHKSPGLIDFAISTLPPVSAKDSYERVVKALAAAGSPLDATYEAPRDGGRKRPDGVQVLWQVTTPTSLHERDQRTDMPFFCHDITPRHLRIPFDQDAITSHKCGATGSARVEVIVPASKYDAYVKLYAALLAVEPQAAKGGNSSGSSGDISAQGVEFAMSSPVSAGVQRPRVWVHSPQTKEDEKWLETRGTGIRSFTVAVEGREGHGTVFLGNEGAASTLGLE